MSAHLRLFSCLNTDTMGLIRSHHPNGKTKSMKIDWLKSEYSVRGGVKIENQENLGQCPNRGGDKKRQRQRFRDQNTQICGLIFNFSSRLMVEALLPPPPLDPSLPTQKSVLAALVLNT